jgi:hypothetical protein
MHHPRHSAIFPDSLVIPATAVLKLIAFDDDTTIFHSFCEFNTYFINEEFSLPVFSVAADKLTDLAEGEKELRPVGSIEYFDKSRTRKSIGYGELNSHGQDSWVLNQRSLDWITRDEMGYSAAIYQPIFDLSEREEFQRFIFRASGDDNYPAINDGAHDGSTHLRDEYVHTLAKEGNMSLDVRTPQRCIVFLNGQNTGECMQSGSDQMTMIIPIFTISKTNTTCNISLPGVAAGQNMEKEKHFQIGLKIRNFRASEEIWP